MNKRGIAEEAMGVIPFIAMVTLVMFGVFGISSSVYAHDISVRDSEARVLGWQLDMCLVERGVFDLGEDYGDDVLEYCGFEAAERIYVGVDVKWGSKAERLESGDSGLLWVRSLFTGAVITGNAISGLESEGIDKIAEYRPGYFSFEADVLVLEEGVLREGKILMEVLVSHEE